MGKDLPLGGVAIPGQPVSFPSPPVSGNGEDPPVGGRPVRGTQRRRKYVVWLDPGVHDTTLDLARARGNTWSSVVEGQLERWYREETTVGE